MAGVTKFRGDVPDGQAPCARCQRLLPVGDFAPEPRKRNGLDSWCRPCRAENMRARRQSDPNGWRDHYLRTTFGITADTFDKMLTAQGGVCAVCGSKVAWSADVTPKNFSVDHDHSCCPGKRSCGQCVRGLLCNTCNRGLGQFRDDPKLLRRAARYLTSRGG